MTKQSNGRARRLLNVGADATPVTLSKRDFAAFSKAQGGVFKPSGKLKGALAEAKKSVRRL